MDSKKPKLFPLDIQLFAEPDPAAPNKPDTGAGAAAAAGVADPVKPGTDKAFTQADMDALAAKIKGKYDKKIKALSVEDGDPNAADPAKSQALDTAPYVMATAKAEIKAQLAMLGVSPEKIPFAVRLIDPAGVLAEGAVSEALTKTAVEAMLKEFPELKKAATEDKAKIKIGANGQQSTSTDDEALAKIFGNTKK